MGIILAGDITQLKPTVISAEETPGWNEFSQQLETSLVARLIRANHPIHQLTAQRRFRPTFSEFLNMRVYQQLLKSSLITKELKVKSGWDDAVRSLIPEISQSFDTGHFVLSLTGSSCDLEQATKSKFNMVHAQAVITLLIENHLKNGYEGEDMVIITPYTAQKNLYRTALFHLREQLPLSHQPQIETIDSIQVREAKLVIVDFVISQADTRADLGFLDDHRCTVAHSRMREVLVTVAPMHLADSPFAKTPFPRQNSSGEVVSSKSPYLVEYVSWASRNKKVIVLDAMPKAIPFSMFHDFGQTSIFADNTAEADNNGEINWDDYNASNPGTNEIVEWEDDFDSKIPKPEGFDEGSDADGADDYLGLGLGGPW
ncbi:hypothetical protein BO82DRAFT_435264 [Aspergillus uvarum CBS 121591]|uniref:DNA2/NAM7 helicase-like C-terminal domain-containing protein n=1 Tax=Aspergillus uvarum CBS 121591 TaxID=1448315 RepID=A0A319C1U4_9EURO|nr:hypothetical protein BO82DRAFT_435264 [Aspergillus uvarum CBS 121591]PYH78167.1 hypothetical protein BO82DRAFT_435264 [Aspergillus uvarum CBS 121591]